MTSARFTLAFTALATLAGCPQTPPTHTEPPAADSINTGQPTVVSPAPTQREAAALTGPWEEARKRGVVFRAVGNEPGWFAEVGAGSAPPLHAVLDYGERTVKVARLQALSGLLGYAGTSDKDERVRLLLERKVCSDGMSDAVYSVAARLEVGDASWRGCGRFLAE